MEIRPIFKKIHPHYESSPGVLRLGERINPVELEDHDGAIHALVNLMDGTRTIEQLYQEMVTQYSYLAVEDLVGAVEEIDRLGFLYDQAAEESTSLTSEQRERFKGNMNYFSLYSDLKNCPSIYQERLLQSHVTILGMGAFGSSLLFNLAGLGVKHVRVVEFDTVSLSNLNRQMLFKESDVGRSKLEAAYDFMSAFYSDMQIEAIDAQIRSVADIEQYIQGTDLVILAADQPFFVIGRWVNQACVKHKIPFVSGGITPKQGMFNTVIPYQSGCFDCDTYWHGERSPDFPQILERLLDSDFVPPNMATAPNMQIITGLIANQVMRLLTNLEDSVSTGHVRIDFQSLEIERREFNRTEQHCPTCGHGDGKEAIFQVFNKTDYQLRPVVDR